MPPGIRRREEDVYHAGQMKKGKESFWLGNFLFPSTVDLISEHQRKEKGKGRREDVIYLSEFPCHPGLIPFGARN